MSHPFRASKEVHTSDSVLLVSGKMWSVSLIKAGTQTWHTL